MEILFSVVVGTLAGGGVWLVLKRQSFQVILGLSLLSYAVNLFLFASGRLAVGHPPLLDHVGPYTDPLPQALVLTAIVISFGMTAVVVMLALGSFLSSGSDSLDGKGTEPGPDA